MTDRNDFGIIGEKVYLRAVEKEDLALVHKWKNDPDFMRLDSFSPEHVISLSALEKDYEDVLKGAQKGGRSFAIVSRKDDRVVGLCSFRHWHDKGRNVEIGMGIGMEKDRGKGFGSDALATILGYLFDELNMHRVELCALAENERAVRCFEKCGFVKEGLIREPAFFDGKYHDVVIMGILRDEFRNKRDG